MLKWDPLFGPVRIAQPRRSPAPGERQEDRAGGHDISAGPLACRQVDGCLIAQHPGARPGLSFGRPAGYVGRCWLDVCFRDDEVVDEAVLEDLFAGLDVASERVAWLMSCYQAMRSRGLWPVNLALEQLLADEEVFIQWGEIQPACPASLQ